MDVPVRPTKREAEKRRAAVVLEARRSARLVDALIRENQIDAATDETNHLSGLLALIGENR